MKIEKPRKVKIRLIKSGVVFERMIVASSKEDALRKIKQYPYAYLSDQDVCLADSIAANLADVI